MADGLTRREVNPDLRIVLDRWVGNEPDFVSGGEMLEVTIPPGEDGTVDGGAETGGLALGERRRRIGHRVGFGDIHGPAPVGGPALPV